MKLKEFNKILNNSAKFNISNRSEEISLDNYVFQHNYKRKNTLKTFALTLSSIILVLIFSFYLYYNSTPYVVLTIDINPSIEVKLNRFNRVIEVSSLNDDALNFISDIDAKRMPLNDFLDLIYEKGLEENYFTDTKANALIGIYGSTFSSENKVLSLINESSKINSLSILYHSENQESMFNIDSGENDESVLSSIIDYYNNKSGEIVSSEYDGDYVLEVPNTRDSIEFSTLPVTEEEFIALANDLDISITKLNIVRFIFENSTDYTTISDFIELANSDISDLIELYNTLE